MENGTKNLALVGYGKMGRLIEQLAPEFDFHVMVRLDEHGNEAGQGINETSFCGVDVAIEFSTPESAPANLVRLANLKVPAVTGTTGWLQHLSDVGEAVEQNKSALVWSPNFSIGVAVFSRLVALAAELLRDEKEYGAWAWEIHHDQKKDARSGTLLHLVETMKTAGYSRHIDVSSNRAGKHPGTHEIGFDSAADTISLRHTARSREGFARGALKSAQWIMGKTGVHTFEEVLFGA
ncbi:MAG: dihydrodipicolinate reductase C-terminal domain-containing protein [Bryobacteraceae bacterium]